MKITPKKGFGDSERSVSSQALPGCTGQSVLPPALGRGLPRTWDCHGAERDKLHVQSPLQSSRNTKVQGLWCDQAKSVHRDHAVSAFLCKQ